MLMKSCLYLVVVDEIVVIVVIGCKLICMFDYIIVLKECGLFEYRKLGVVC